MLAAEELTLLAEAFVAHVDAAADEARRARDRMLLYVQFTQDCCGLSGSLAAALEESGPGPSASSAEDAEAAERAATASSMKKAADHW